MQEELGTAVITISEKNKLSATKLVSFNTVVRCTLPTRRMCVSSRLALPRRLDPKVQANAANTSVFTFRHSS